MPWISRSPMQSYSASIDIYHPAIFQTLDTQAFPAVAVKNSAHVLHQIIGFENRDINISEPSFINPTPALEARAYGVQW